MEIESDVSVGERTLVGDTIFKQTTVKTNLIGVFCMKTKWFKFCIIFYI